MPDHATSTDAAVQAQLDRLFAAGPGTDVLGLDRIMRLLARLGDPHRALPPVFHVAGTNGKGSTCAFLRTALEAAGHRVHVYTSPHLVRFNERIRLAGRLIDDAALAALLAEVLDAAQDLRASFFEVTTAATFLAFARTPADACVVEIGLGGRLDATNVLERPAVCGIAALGIDHQSFLGDTLAQIAAEKAGIAKPGVPLVTMTYPPDIEAVVRRTASAAGAPLFREGSEWTGEHRDGQLRYTSSKAAFVLPEPALPGRHQGRNLLLATAMLMQQDAVAVAPEHLRTAAGETRWPGRMQRLSPGPLTRLMPPGAALWIDGGHNADAAAALAATLRTQANGTTTLILGMLANKDAPAMIAALAPLVARVIAVPVPGHAHHAPAELAELARAIGIAAQTAPDLPTALARTDGPVIAAGSLYLAGEALRLNEEWPD